MAKLGFYLDTRRATEEKKYPLKISVSHKSKSTHITTGFYYTPVDWDAIDSMIKNKKRFEWTREAEDVYTLRTSYEAALRRLDYNEDLSLLDSVEIRDRLMEAVAGTSPTRVREERAKTGVTKKNRFLPHYRKYMESRDTAGTREMYNRTLKKILEYDTNAEKVTFDMINKEWLSGFDAHLATTTCTNIRNMHFRNIRAAFNAAIDDDLTTCDPFRKFKLPKLEETRKRALSLQQIQQLKDYPCEAWQEEYRDMFMLQFYLIGINLVDLLTAKPEDIVDSRFEYRRDKTHKLYSIKIEPEAMAIINKYRGEKYLLSPMDRYASHKNYMQHMNRALKTIGLHYTTSQEKKGKALFPELSTYWSRHTWASVASSLDISMELIGRALGHAWVNKTITSVYIDFDTRKVDEANRQVIDAVCGKSAQKKRGRPKKA